MLQKAKKQRKEKDARASLKMFPSLLEPSLPLTPQHPHSQLITALRIATALEWNYLFSTYLQLIHKVAEGHNSVMSIENLKVGFIGGGVMGRLLLNSLLVFEKEGLSLKNVTLSTRQVENFHHYEECFGINVIFDNEKVVEESDVLVVTVPSTLDNWIFNDFKDSLLCRIKITKPHETNPLIFVTTSNMTPKKLDRLYSFPILTPAIRGENTEILKSLSSLQTVEEYEEALKTYVTEKQHTMKITQCMGFIVEKIFSKSLQTTITSEVTSKKSKANKSVSMGSSLQLSQGAENTKMEVIEETLNLQQTPEITFLVRCKKWRMAFHNFKS